MLRPLLFFIVAMPLASLGCLSSQGSSPNAPGIDGGEDASVPVQTFDGSVNVDASVATLTTGLGAGTVTHSQHYTLITKTGNEPGGAGVKSSSSFHLISGAAAAGVSK
jgi:hypothetical protein